MKQCISCRILKDESQFQKENPEWPLFSRCEQCRSEEENRLWFSAHPNASRAQREAHQESHVAAKAMRKAMNLTITELVAEWNLANPTDKLTRYKWVRRNSERVRALQEETAWEFLEVDI